MAKNEELKKMPDPESTVLTKNEFAYLEKQVKQCSQCGKNFSVWDASAYAYKKKARSGMKYFCSWGCLRTDEQENKK